MSLSVLDYDTIGHAVEVSREPSPPCPQCEHALGWHTWGVSAIGKPPLLTLLGICQYVREQEGAKATTYRPCTCRREQALTP